MPQEHEWKLYELGVHAEFTCWFSCELGKVPKFYPALMHLIYFLFP